MPNRTRGRLCRYALLLAAALACGPASAAIIMVNSSGDAAVAGDGACTLREAITNANALADLSGGDCGAGGADDLIAFLIPAGDPGCSAITGVCTIRPTSPLPFVTEPVEIDGYLQPGAAPNTLPSEQGLNSRILIELDGSLAGAGATGLWLGGLGNSRVSGLAIVGFGGSGVRVASDGNTIVGNFIGIRADGDTVAGNRFGVFVDGGAGGNDSFIGDAGGSNLIAGNTAIDIVIFQSTGNRIDFNLIGIDVTGTQARKAGAGTGGISVTGDNNALSRNIIGGTGAGIILSGARQTDVQSNAIGIGVGGVPLGNGTGVIISNRASGPSELNFFADNVIAYNVFIGIWIRGSAELGDPTGNMLIGNRIHSNGGLGIDLQPAIEFGAQVTDNDAGDADSGPNRLQNFPWITWARVNAATGAIEIAYTLDSAAGQNYQIMAYANDDCHESGYGEGQHYGGGFVVTTDGGGHAEGILTVPAPWPSNWAVGKYVTLLARSLSTDDTSEFSYCMSIDAAAANQPPAPAADSYATPYNTSLVVGPAGVLANDSDPDAGDTLTVSAWTDPANGTLSGTGADGRFTYTPDSGYSGADAFQYQVRDSQGAAATATVTITVGAPLPSGSSGSVAGPTGSGSGNAVAAFTSPAAGCAFQSQAFQPVPANAPAGWNFPHGMVDFVIGGCAVNGSSVSLTLTFPQPLPPGTAYWKWGPQTPGGPDVWYQMPGVTISGNQVSFTLIDGALGDDDLSANGLIVDAGGPAAPAAAPPGGDGVAAIPTLSEWGLMLLTLLLGGTATGAVRRAPRSERSSS